METAILASGCFWGAQDLLRKIPGVISSEVGYSGGTTPNPDYTQMKTGKTGHAEAVKIEFDPAKVSFDALLEFFFRMHNPTTLNQQGNDMGSQYRSAVFYTSDEQKKVAENKVKDWNASGKWKNPLVTEVTKAGPFYSAEDYHQDYLIKNPGGYSCHFVRDL